MLATWLRFRKGKRAKKNVIAFEADLATNLLDLHISLRDKTYAHEGYAAFTVADPKPRNIHKASVRDRVLHHLIYHHLYPYFDRRFIFDSYSCRNGKGTHRALARFRTFARAVSRNNTRTCWVLKGDIRKFFASIDHAVLKGILAHHITDTDFLWLIEQVIDSFHSTRPGMGLPLGNLTSQILVNIYMHEFDRFVKQELRLKRYIRYADDFVVLSEDKKGLENVLPQMMTFLHERLHLELHPNKVSIHTFASGIDFLGWTHFPYHRTLRSSTRKKIERVMRCFPKPETYASYRGLLAHGNTYLLRKRNGLIEPHDILHP